MLCLFSFVLPLFIGLPAFVKETRRARCVWWATPTDGMLSGVNGPITSRTKRELVRMCEQHQGKDRYTDSNH